MNTSNLPPELQMLRNAEQVKGQPLRSEIHGVEGIGLSYGEIKEQTLATPNSGDPIEAAGWTS